MVIQNRQLGRGLRGVLMVLVLLAMNLVGPHSVAALTCRAEVDRNTARQGDVVVLTVSAEGDFGWSADFEVPSVAGASLSGGGTNQSVSLINGKTQATVSHTYYLTITGHDDVSIGPVIVKAGQDQCETERLTIKVGSATGGTSGSPAGTAGVGKGTQGNRSVTGTAISRNGGSPGDDIFVSMKSDISEAYVGQQIILTFSYWHRVQPWNNPTFTPPRTEGFWREDLGQERNSNRILQGRNYSVTQVRYALFPTHSGDLTIEPAELRFAGDVFDRFFSSRSRSRGPRVLRTDPIVIKVRELPVPQPDGFSGLVATSLELRAQADQDSVQVGDPISLKVFLTSDAFLKGYQGLNIVPPAGSRLHDATNSFKTEVAGGRLVGNIAVEKILVPQQGGPLQVPALKLVWFDAVHNSYQVAEARVRPITVTGENLASDSRDPSGFLRAGITRLGDDLAFIHPVPRHLRFFRQPHVRGVLWWALLLLPLVLLGMWKFYLDKVAAAGRNPYRLRQKRALRRARALLEQAREAGDPGETCTFAAQALRGYVADCQGIEASEVGSLQVNEFATRVVDGRAGDRMGELLDQCDAIRFGGIDKGHADSLVQDIGVLLQEIELGRKSGKGHQGKTPATSLALVVFIGLLWPGMLVQAGQGLGTDPVRLLAEGNDAYTSGNLAEAEKLYLQVRDLGVDDSILHFNLGNTYARQGKLGQAVSCYLRAKRLAPRDKDIRQNLDWVRNNIKDLELAHDSLPLFIAQISSVIDFLTLDEWSDLCLILMWALCLLVAWILTRGYWGDRLRRTLVAFGVVLVMVAGATGWRWYQDYAKIQGVVVAVAVDVLSGPAESFPTLFQVHDGLTVHLVGRQDGWVRISLGGDWTGWLPTGDVEVLDPIASSGPVHR